MTGLFASAKKVFDFYLEHLGEDNSGSNIQFAQQYAHLRVLRYRTESIVSAMESYKIET